MKALVISMLILLVAFFSFTPAFGQVSDNNKLPQPQLTGKKEEPAKIPAYKKVGDANKAADANVAAEANAVTEVNKVAEANTIADPNAAIRAKIKEFDGLEDALRHINQEGRDEITKWTLNKEDKLELALAAQKQITEELKFLRELAAKEEDAKTAAAIDGILLDRQDRFKDVIDRLEQESEKTRRHAEQDEKRKEQQERGTNPTRVRPRERPATSR